jgi:short subunit dehydrogenase-like uncharacterized protein
MPRDLDLVLLGATGFTGGLTAEYLARNAPEGLRWAIAGRNPGRLEEVRERLAGIDPALHDLELCVVDSADPVGLRELTERSALVASTVGPYVQHGEPLVAACAETGTDYCDLTGELEFVDRMWLAHHATAEASGARLVHACGFDSVPHDLGAWWTRRFLPADVPVTMRGVVRTASTPSGGTMHTALEALGRARQMRGALQERRRREPRPEGRRSRAVAGKPHRDSLLGYWLLPLPTLDPFVVARSGAALPEYGPDFRYSHYAGMKTLRYAAAGTVGMGAMAVGAQVPPVRSFLKSRVAAGTGPDEARRERSWFTVDFVAEGGGERVRTRVSGGDPGYDETATMLAESALCLLLDDNPETAGQVTTAQAMAENLHARLVAAGMGFEQR